MQLSNNYKGREQALADLYGATFADSEGAEEGQLIGKLAYGLLTTTAADDIHTCFAQDKDTLLGCAIFTRMRFDNDDRKVFILAPMAIATPMQGKGLGQKLIRFGLNGLRDQGIDIALTYGDPNYYMRVGYRQITETDVPAPFKLQFPEGWLGQSLTDAPLTPLQGPSHCVTALNDAAFW